MRKIIFIFFLLFSSFVLAEPPACTATWFNGCYNSLTMSNVEACSGGTYYVDSAVPQICGTYGGQPQTTFSCRFNCTCPEGLELDNLQGCVDPNACPEGQFNYAGLCSEVEQSPTDCTGFPSVIAVGDGYLCSYNESCPEGTNAGTYSHASGTWTTCTPADNNSSSSDSNSSASNSSSGSGGGDDEGGGDDSGGGSGGDGGSGGVNGGSSSSSSSSGSGSGNTSSSGSGGDGEGEAGDCDPTATNYFECITSDNNNLDHGSPSGFGDTGASAMLSQVQGEYAAAVNSIKAEVSQHFTGQLTGSGSLQDICETIRGVQVCFGFAKFSSQLASIGNVFFFVACIVSFMIVVRR